MSMNATTENVNSLLGLDVQYKVPLYQRRYVWEEANWSVLWKDILDQEEIESFENAKHFTGPIVTRLIKGQQKRFEVIDGQQRLMTFQIIFCVIRDLCKSSEFCNSETEKMAKDHLENGETAIRDFKQRDVENNLPDPTYKFIPTEYDGLAFEEIVKGQYGQNIHDIFDVKENTLKQGELEGVILEIFREKKVSRSILDAYGYFYEQIRNHIQEDCEKISNLLQTTKSNFELVQITPSQSQQAEEIFESVNATGRKLSEFDYLRNNLFLRADDESDEFYGKYWIFENDPSYDWHTDRLEWFFQAFLMAKLGPDVLNDDPKLFDVYQQELMIPGRSVEKEFEDIKNFAESYKKLDVDPEFGSRMQFYRDLSTYKDEESYNSDFASRYKYNITLVRSFVMYLQHGLNRTPDREEILKVLEILESYVIRRILVDAVTGRYPYQAIKSCFRNLYKSQGKDEFFVESIVNYLVNRGKRKWIFNLGVRNWFEDNRYRHYHGSLVQDLEFTERYILYRIENWKRRKAGENPLSFAKEEFPPTREPVLNYTKLQDEYAVASLGNLTFCWGGEARPSDADFDQKRIFLKSHNNYKLILNREICEAENWWTQNVKKRTEDLLFIFREIWKGAEDFLNSTNSWKGLENKYEVGSLIKGTVVDVSSRWGAILQLEQSIKGRIPKEEMAWTTGNIDPAEYVKEDDVVEVKVIEISEEKQIFLLSRKRTLPDPWAEVPKKYKVGSVMRGKISNITDYGAFAELEEGVTGLIHISELADRKIERPEEIVSVGEELELKVITLDPETRRIGLSLKTVRHDPWAEVPEKYKVGVIVRGKIVSLTDLGAFAELEGGIRGLIHYSELAYKRFERPEEIVSIDEELDLKVIRVRPEENKIELSLRAVRHDPWAEASEKYKVGSVVRRKIVRLTNFGAFAELEEGIDGLIPNSELSNRWFDNPAEIVSVGDVLDLKVINVNPKERKIALSLKKAIKKKPSHRIAGKKKKSFEVRTSNPKSLPQTEVKKKPLPRTTVNLGNLIKEAEKDRER